MRNVVLFLVVIMGAARASAMDQDRTIVLAWELLESARFGRDPKEHAAFVVIDDGGQLQLSRWPWGAESMRATYRGKIPGRARAIIHTHPHDLPNPSPGDIALARKLGLAVYVITRTSVTLTDGSRTTRVARGDWNPRR